MVGAVLCMAKPRITAEEVKGVIDTKVANLAPFIAIATLVVDNNLLEAGLSDDTLKQIELFLACHYVSLREPTIASERIGDSNVVHYRPGVKGSNLMSSDFGQTAIQLDTSGVLRNLGNYKNALFISGC